MFPRYSPLQEKHYLISSDGTFVYDTRSDLFFHKSSSSIWDEYHLKKIMDARAIQETETTRTENLKKLHEHLKYLTEKLEQERKEKERKKKEEEDAKRREERRLAQLEEEKKQRKLWKEERERRRLLEEREREKMYQRRKEEERIQLQRQRLEEIKRKKAEEEAKQKAEEERKAKEKEALMEYLASRRRNQKHKISDATLKKLDKRFGKYAGPTKSKIRIFTERQKLRILKMLGIDPEQSFQSFFDLSLDLEKVNKVNEYINVRIDRKKMDPLVELGKKRLLSVV